MSALKAEALARDNEALRAEVARLREAFEIARDALRFYAADQADASDCPWRYDYGRQRWYFVGPHPADIADFALCAASLAERGERPPFEDYGGQAKRKVLDAWEASEPAPEAPEVKSARA